MSLLPMESLPAILDNISLRQSKSEDHVSLVIPSNDLLSYYNSRLLDDAITVSERLLLTLNLPLASKQTALYFLKSK